MGKGKGRPHTLIDPNNPFLEIMNEVLDDDIYVVALTDKELFEEINDRLRDRGYYQYIMSSRWWERLKASVIEEDWDEMDYHQHEFCRVYKKALRRMKRNLVMTLAGLNWDTGEYMEGSDKSWTRIAWIIERKFRKDWGAQKQLESEDSSKEEDGNLTIKQTFSEELLPKNKIIEK